MEKTEILNSIQIIKEAANAIGFNLSDKNHFSEAEVLRLLEDIILRCDEVLKKQ